MITTYKMETMAMINTIETAVAGVAEVAGKVSGLLPSEDKPIEAPNVVISDQAATAESEVYSGGDAPDVTASTVEPEVGQLNLQRFVRLATAEWPITTEAEHLMMTLKLPDAFIDPKFPTYNLAKNYQWARSDFEFSVIVNTNASFAGALVMVYVPEGAYFQFDSFMNFPYVMINCSLNTGARLRIPYVNRKQYVKTVDDDQNAGEIRLYCLAKLRVPASASTYGTYTVYGRLVGPEFQAFKVLEGRRRFARGGEVVRVEQGQGAMFLASRHHTALRPRMGIASEHARPDQRVVGNSVIYNLFRVVNIPSFWMGLDWDQSNEIGKLLLETNVAVEGTGSATGNTKDTMNIGFLSRFFYGYQGDLLVTVQAVASKLNQGKLLIAFFPGPDVRDHVLTIDKVNNAFTQVLDLGDRTTVQFTLPYVSQTTYRDTSEIHGRFAVFVLNRLTYTAAAPQTVRVLFYLSAGSSFKFVYPKAPMKAFEGPSDDEWEDVSDGETEDAGNVVDGATTNLEDLGTSIAQMRRPIFRNVRVQIPNQVKADHMDLKLLKGRAFPVLNKSMTTKFARNTLAVLPQCFGQLYKIFRYRKGDMTLHISNTSSSHIYIAHSYFANSEPATETEQLALILGMGAVAVPPLGMASICVPYYVFTPFVGADFLGYLFSLSVADSSYALYVSTTFDSDTEFFFLQSPPKVVPDSEDSDEEDVDWGVGRMRLRLSGDVEENPGPMQDVLDEIAKVAMQVLCVFIVIAHILVTWMRERLLLSGDVERNPGPTFDEELMTLVSKEKAPSYNYIGFLNEYKQKQNSFSMPPIEILREGTPNEPMWVTWYPGSTARVYHRILKISKQKSAMALLAQIDLRALKNFIDSQLLLAGDVERNPGPCLLRKDKGVYHHYGVQVGDYVVHMSSDNVLSVLGSGEVEIVSTPYVPSEWTVVCDVDSDEDKLLSRAYRYAKEMGHFSVRNNCQTFVNYLIGEDVALQSKGLMFVAYVLLGVSVMGVMVPEGTLMERLTGISDENLSKLNGMMDMLNPQTLNSIVSDIKNKVLAGFLKGMVRLVCYSMIVAHNPTTATILSVTILAGMDVAGCGSMFGDLTESIHKLVGDSAKEEEVDSNDVVEVQNQIRKKTGGFFSKFAKSKKTEGVKDFNLVSQAAKNFEWWIEKVMTLIRKISDWINPSKHSAAVSYLAYSEDEILSDICQVNEFVVEVKDAGFLSESLRTKWKSLSDKLSHHLANAVSAIGDKRVSLIQTAISALNRIQIGQKQPELPYRIEPVAIHFFGDPGCGKTLLINELAARLARNLASDVYHHPSGSEYFDNYTGQKVHVIDEFLMTREENDANLVLQLISSTHVPLPIAACEYKGIFYKGEVLITASNSRPQSENKLVCRQALARRFTEIEVRPVQTCTTIQGSAMVLDVSKAIMGGLVEGGACWEVKIGCATDTSAKWQLLSMDDLERLIMRMHKKNSEICKVMNDSIKKYKKVEGDLPMDCLEMNSEYLPKVRERWEKMKPSDKTLKWIFGLVSAIFALSTIICFAWAMITWFRRNPEEEEQVDSEGAYSGVHTRPTIRQVSKFLKTAKTPEGPVEVMPVHILKNVVLMSWADGTVQKAMALGDREICTYAHDVGSGPLTLKWRGGSLVLAPEEIELINVQFENEGKIRKTDFVTFEIPKCYGIQFTNIRRHISEIEETRDGVMFIPVDEYTIEKKSVTNLLFEDHQWFKNFGDRYGHVSYRAMTRPGHCGSPVFQMQRGTWKLVAMHNASNGRGDACGLNLAKFIAMEAEGVAEVVGAHRRIHQSPSTGLTKTPIHGCFEELKQPAALSPKDKRLEVQIDDLVKNSTKKYRVDVFDPDVATFLVAKSNVAQRLKKVVSVGHNTKIDNAIRGLDGNAIDPNTSPGLKYREQNLAKKDLFRISNTGDLWISEKLQSDVAKKWMDLTLTGYIDTTFTAHLKDELRPIAKVKLGKTRVIEGCELDYVVVYRMVMSTIYRDLYASPTVASGVAVGCDPLVEAHDWHSCVRAFDNIMALDYSGFDGSLSENLMRHAVDILSSLHEDPDLVRALHEPVVMSTHVVSDEVWFVRGGMPSGSPCTSVLNTVCNLLMLEYAMEKFVNSNWLTFAYGDDCVVAHDGDKVKAEVLTGEMKRAFGVEITPADKGSGDLYVHISQVQFLKRTFVHSVEFNRYVGVLDLGVIQQALMWTRNYTTFDSQLQSLSVELAAHGERIYEENRAVVNRALRKSGSQVAMAPYSMSVMCLAMTLQEVLDPGTLWRMQDFVVARSDCG